MKTAELLKSLPEKHLNYLENLKETYRKAKSEEHRTLTEQTKATARGYIKALENCGIIADFKPLWCWFTI